MDNEQYPEISTEDSTKAINDLGAKLDIAKLEVERWKQAYSLQTTRLELAVQFFQLDSKVKDLVK